MGNRLAATRTLTSTQTHSYSYDGANRLSVADGVAYTWDAAGNLRADGVYTYSYDPEQRLVGVTGPGLAWSAGYDPDGLRRWQATNGVTTTYRLDLQPPLATVLQASSPSGTISYLYGMGDSPLASEAGSAWRYLSGRDALNSVRQETDAAGQVLTVRRFDPYGAPLVGDGGQPYGYSGEWWDAATGLVYLRARYLRPELGLFTSRDPWPGDVRRPGTLHGYAYGMGNPLRFTDPAGLWTIGIGLGYTRGFGGGYSGSLTLVFDDKGQAALVRSYGGGGYAGYGGGFAATLQATDADRVQDLNGLFAQTGGSLQLALFNGGAEWVVQAAPDGAARRSVNGLNINLGAGVDLKKILCPLEFHSMFENSIVHVLPTATMFDEGVDPNLFWRY